LARGILQVINGCLKAHIGVDAESGLVDWRGRHGGEWGGRDAGSSVAAWRENPRLAMAVTPAGTSLLSIRTAK
jgi:hypothetical protein